jgi:integrase
VHAVDSGTYAPTTEAVRLLVGSFERHLRALGRAPDTLHSYAKILATFLAWADDRPIDKAVVEDYLTERRQRLAASTVALEFTVLRRFFRWADDEGELANPMARMRRQTVDPAPVDVIPDEWLSRLLKVCEGREFKQRRDTAILRVLNEGVRRGEIAGIHTKDVDWRGDLIHVVGKGARARAVPMSPKTAAALDRYMRERTRHRYADEPQLWLGQRGPLAVKAFQSILDDRCAEAGVPHLHPHQFRHTAAHVWLDSGGQEGDAMKIFGWRSREMVDRYGASVATERALAAARRMKLGDRI